jgi:hypothetical protein
VNPLSSIGGVTRISVSDTQKCLSQEEGYPERSYATTGPVSLFAPYDATFINSASDWNTWSQTYRYTVPAVSGYTTARGDAWATSSPQNLLEYVSTIAVRNSDNYYCLGVGSTTVANLPSNTWSPSPASPVTCIRTPNPGLSDGPAIHFTTGLTSALYAVEKYGSTFNLFILSPCFAAPPGSTNCPVKYSLGVSVTGLLNHPTVVENPCTHNAIVAYRRSTGEVMLKFFDQANGSTINTYTVRTGQLMQANDNCSGTGGCPGGNNTICKCMGPVSADCGGSGCMRTAYKVHVSTKVDYNGTCYAYLAYDSSNTASDGHTYFKSKLDVVDITSDTAPNLLKGWISYATSSTNNTFQSTSTGSTDMAGGVGWFWYNQRSGNACDTIYEGATDANFAITNTSYTGTIDGPFKTVLTGGTDGLGDYVGIIKRGLAGGSLFPSWSRPVYEPVMFNPPCLTCQSSPYRVVINGAEVTP